jgi:protein Tex
VDADELLDNTVIHPESYSVVCDLFALVNISGAERDLPSQLAAFRQHTPLAEIAKVLGCGEPTLTDIFEQLSHPSRRSPRKSSPNSPTANAKSST